MDTIGIVVIGRNEGERLLRCLQSLLTQIAKDLSNSLIVYVDSGSTDNSVSNARALVSHVVELDPSIPFTMARGRNAGFSYLMEVAPDLEFVQFIDGDCEIVPSWLEQGLTILKQNENVAIVCGRRRERFPNTSPYNLLADMEWNTPIGEAAFCGGDFIARTVAIQQVNGFNPVLICGEEPEMCIRLRQKGWKIYRVDTDMTLHDAAMLKFSQWWKRSIRGGWAVAEGRAMHGNSPEAYMVRQSFSGWLWGLFIPIVILVSLWPTRGLSLLLLLAYAYLAWRIYLYRKETFGDSPAHARTYALFCVLSKFPQMVGQVKYLLSRLFNQPANLIEYKAIPNRQ